MFDKINKKKIINKKKHNFLNSCFISFIGLLFFIIGREKIFFPLKWLKNEELNSLKLFFLGTNIYLQTNFIISIFFIFFKSRLDNGLDLKKIKSWINKIIIFFFSLIIIYTKNLLNKNNFSQIVLFFISLIITNYCLIEILMKIMNNYGICNSFNLIFCFDFIPKNWIKKKWNKEKIFELIFLYFITWLFIFITNLKWEIPVETNQIINKNNEIFKKKIKFGLKMDFSFVPFFYLSSFFSIFSIICKKVEKKNFFSTFFLKLNNFFKETEIILINNKYKELNFEKKNLFKIFYILSKNGNYFLKDNFLYWIKKKNWKIFICIFLIIFSRWLVTMIQKRKIDWKPEEIAKDLQKKGIYMININPGLQTKKIIINAINKIVLIWVLFNLILNIFFDNFFLEKDLIFSNWFNFVNIGIDIIKQIKIRYRYIHSED